MEAHLDTLIQFNLKDFVDENGNPKPLHELTPEQAVCVKELGVIETQIGTHRSLKFYNKLDAIKLKMQRLGMLKEKVEKTGSFELWLAQIKDRKNRGGSTI